MATVEEDLKSFTQFVHERLKADNRELGLAELLDLWLIENPDDAAYAEDVAAVQASLDDFRKGERGTPAGEHSRELRQELGNRAPSDGADRTSCTIT